MRYSRSLGCLFALLMLGLQQQAYAYSVLTHEQVIDLTWKDSIEPLLLQRYPGLTAAQLREAEGYAYGGCVIQDLGYYPFGSEFFSNLTHYVRSGDFVRALFRDAKNADELAFAIGALSHYLGDSIGHPQAVNLAVGLEFPALEQRYGPNVNYGEGEHQHIRAEFAFDVNEVSKHRMPPERYLNHIGFSVPTALLARAFYETYGLDLAKVLGKHRPTFHGYHFSVRTFLPRVAYAETLRYRKRMPADVPSASLDKIESEVAQLAIDDDWSRYKRSAGIGTHMLAAIFFILPKVGVLSDLSLRGPTPKTEQDYLDSLVRVTDRMRTLLANATKSDGLENLDLDTGLAVRPGSYRLTDETYAELLNALTRNPATPVPFGVKRDVLAYYADPNAPIATKKDPDKWAKVQAELPILSTISTRAEYPAIAFLPEPVPTSDPGR